MKRLLLFVALIVSGAMMMTSQARWELGDQINASQIKDGDTVIIEYVASQLFAGQYLTLDVDAYTGKLGTEGQINDANIWVFEQGPETELVEGGKTFYLKNVSTGRYVKASGGFSDPFSTETDIANATSFYLASCGQDLPGSNCIPWDGDGNKLKEGESGDEHVNWGTNGDGIGAVTENSLGFLNVYDGTSYNYMTCYWGTISFTGLQMCNQWNVFKATYIDDRKSDLQAVVDQYTSFSPIGGTEPGYYQQDAADKYNNVLQEAVLLLLNGGTNAEYLKAIDDLNTAYRNCRNSVIPVNEGYYYIVSAYDGFQTAQGVEKAMYTDESTNTLRWTTFVDGDPTFAFKITPTSESNLFYVQNYLTDLYAGPQPEWFAGTTSLTTTPQITKRLTMEVEGMYLFTGSEHSYPGYAGGASPFRNTPNDAQVSGDLVAWGRVNNSNDQEYIFTNHTNLWYLRPVSDEAISGMAAAKAQHQLTQQLSQMIDEAYEVLPKLFSFDTSTTGLITVAGVQGHDFGHEITGNQIRYTNPIHDDNQERDIFTNDYAYLIDGNDRTYVSSRGGYVEVDLPAAQQAVTFSVVPRYGLGSTGDADSMALAIRERPNNITIYAGNGSSYKKMASGTMNYNTIPATFSVQMDSAYQHLRFVVDNNVGGGSYFCISEFQVYSATANQQTSQYYSTEGMKAAADKVYSLMMPSWVAVQANNVTQEQVTEMRSALDAVEDLYADTVQLANLIAQCESMMQGVEVGDGMGQISSQELVTNLQNAIAQARQTAFVSPVSVEAVRTATANITAARNAFMAGLKSIEEGKWYYITNTDAERAGEVGTEDAACGGRAIYLNGIQSSGSITKWGLYDDASQSLNADNNPAAMWRFIKTDTVNNYYAIQNLKTGYYLGGFAGDNINVPVSETRVPYEIAFNGTGSFLLYPRNAANAANEALWPEGAEADVVCHATGTAASGWTFVEIDPEAQEAISVNHYKMNAMDVMTVPYNVSNISEYNPDAHIYSVRKMSQETNADGQLVTTIEFYETQELKAGQPCLLVVGDTASTVETEEFDLLIPFPTEVIDHTQSCVSNGLLGGLHGLSVGEGTGMSDLKKFFAVGASGSGFSAQTGVIDPSTYQGEVEGQTTALTLTVTGLKALSTGSKFDVNGDGAVTSADIAAVYNYIANGDASGISTDKADVNGDGTVNAADVAAIYTSIAGGSASSKKYLNRIFGLSE